MFEQQFFKVERKTLDYAVLSMQYTVQVIQTNEVKCNTLFSFNRPFSDKLKSFISVQLFKRFTEPVTVLIFYVVFHLFPPTFLT